MWVAAADKQEGRREEAVPGLAASERDELARLRRENKQLRVERDILSKSRGLVCTRERRGGVRLFGFMSVNQACFPIATMARVLGASKAGYYAWVRRPPSSHAVADKALLKRVRTVHASLRQTYGAPRVHADLRACGEHHVRKRIARLMRQAGLIGASHRHGGPTTTRRDKDARQHRIWSTATSPRPARTRSGSPTSPRYCRRIQAACASAVKRVTRVLARGRPSSQFTMRDTFMAAAVQACCNPVLARPM